MCAALARCYETKCPLYLVLFLAAIAALYVTMSVGWMVGRSVGWSATQGIRRRGVGLYF